MAGVALAVVGIADEQVGEHAVEPLSAQQVEALGVGTPATSAPAPAVTSSTTALPTTTTVTTEDMGSSATSTTDPIDVTVTTEFPGTVTTTTTAPEETATIDSRQITGGTVVVRWTSSYVELVSASPADGFEVDVESRGPNRVEVEFEGDDVTSVYSAKISNGQLVVHVDVAEDDDDEGDD